jgi:hypothetical protein
MRSFLIFLVLAYATAMTEFTCHKIIGAACNVVNETCAYSPGLSENYKCDSDFNCVHPHVNTITKACNMSNHAFGEIVSFTEPIGFFTSNRNGGLTPDLDALYAKALRRIQATPDPTAVGNAVNYYLKDKFNEVSCATEISESHFLPKGALKWTVCKTTAIEIPIVDANPWSTFEEMDRRNKADRYLKELALNEHLGWSGPNNIQYATTTTQIEEHLSYAAILSSIDYSRNSTCLNNEVFNKYEQRGDIDDYCIQCPNGKVLYSTYTDVSYSESSTQRYNICIDCNGPTRFLNLTDGSCTINYAAEIVDSLIYDLYTLIMENALTFQEYKTFISQRWRTCSQDIDDWVPGDVMDYKFTTTARAKIECDADNCIQIKTPDECNAARMTLGIDGLDTEYSYSALDFQFKYGNTEGCYFDNSTKRLFWVDKTTNGNFNTSGFYIVSFQEIFTRSTTYFGDFMPVNISQKYWREKITEENIVFSEKLYGKSLYIQTATQFGLLRSELDARDTDTNTIHIADLHDSETMMHNSLWIECAGDDCWSVGPLGETCPAASERLGVDCGVYQLRQTAVCGWDRPCNSNDFNEMNNMCCTPKILCSGASPPPSRRRFMMEEEDSMMEEEENPCELGIVIPTLRCTLTPIGSTNCSNFQQECCSDKQTCEQGFTANGEISTLNKNSQCLNAVRTVNNLGEPTLCNSSSCNSTDFETCCEKETCNQARDLRGKECNKYGQRPSGGWGNYSRRPDKSNTCPWQICDDSLFEGIGETTCCGEAYDIDEDCHPAESKVRVQHSCGISTCVSSRRMDELKIGDMVESEVGIFEPVIAQVHSDNAKFTVYNAFYTNASQIPLYISDGHYLYTNGTLMLPENVDVGHTLRFDHKEYTITRKEQVVKRGLFHVNTWRGTIIVDGYKTSVNMGFVDTGVQDFVTTPLLWCAYTLGFPINLSPEQHKRGWASIQYILPTSKLITENAPKWMWPILSIPFVFLIVVSAFPVEACLLGIFVYGLRKKQKNY